MYINSVKKANEVDTIKGLIFFFIPKNILIKLETSDLNTEGNNMIIARKYPKSNCLLGIVMTIKV